jgi:monoamine oxidase
VSPLDLLAQTPNPSRPIHVVIVGAGLAGLVCAYELQKRCDRATILEADARHIGGRVRTLRFGGGLHGEAGAMRIPTRHAITRRYVAEFGLRLRKFVYSNPDAYLFVRGQRERVAQAARLMQRFRLKEDERAESLDDLWTRAVTNAVAGLSDAERNDLVADAPVTDAFGGWISSRCSSCARRPAFPTK